MCCRCSTARLSCCIDRAPYILIHYPQACRPCYKSCSNALCATTGTAWNDVVTHNLAYMPLPYDLTHTVRALCMFCTVESFKETYIHVYTHAATSFESSVTKCALHALGNFMLQCLTRVATWYTRAGSVGFVILPREYEWDNTLGWPHSVYTFTLLFSCLYTHVYTISHIIINPNGLPTHSACTYMYICSNTVCVCVGTNLGVSSSWVGCHTTSFHPVYLYLCQQLLGFWFDCLTATLEPLSSHQQWPKPGGVIL